MNTIKWTSIFILSSFGLFGCWTTGGGPDGDEHDAALESEMDGGGDGQGGRSGATPAPVNDIINEGRDAMAPVETDAAMPSDADAAMPLGPDIEVTQVEVGEFVFDVRVAGPEDGDPVVLLHGFPQTSLEFEAQIFALAEAGYRAIAPNQRGYSSGARPARTA